MDAVDTFLKKHNYTQAQQSNDPHQDDNMGGYIPPTLYRIYRGTVQRQVASHTSLSSHAAFLLLLDNESQVLGWIGTQCEQEDADLLQELGIEVMMRDYGSVNVKSIPLIYENDDPTPLLEAFLDIMQLDSNTYYNKLTAAERRKGIENNSVSIGSLIPPKDLNDSSLFELKETSFAHPDHNGIVPRVPFPHLERDTIVYITIGDQWDLWFARGVSETLMEYSIKFLESIIAAQIQRTLGINDPTNHIIDYFQITHQGEERQCFRRPLKIFTDFEPFDYSATGKDKASGGADKSTGFDENPISDRDIRLVVSEHITEQDIENSHAYDEQYFAGIKINHLNENNAGGTTETMMLNASSAYNLNSNASSNNLRKLASERSNLTMNSGAGEEKGTYANSSATNFWTDVKRVNKLSGRKKSFNPLLRNHNNENNKAIISIAPPSQKTHIRANDFASIQSHLLDLNEVENISIVERKLLVEESCSNPDILLGWQVEIDDGIYSGTFVIIGTKKSTIRRKTYFHLASSPFDEFWVRLKRKTKKGVPFRPLRQVAIIDIFNSLLDPDFAQSNESGYGRGIEDTDGIENMNVMSHSDMDRTPMTVE